MFERYTRDPRRRILFYTIIVMVVYAYQVFRTGWPSLEEVIIFIGLVMFAPVYPEFRQVPMPESIRAILNDVVLFSVMFGLSMVFFAQFTLPLKHTRERAQAALRLFLYMLGAHGMAIFINDGKIVRGDREGEKKGYGVMLLDTASAAVLRTSKKVTRVVGPGVAFLDAKETIGGLVDLHRQGQFLGPLSPNDPFLNEKIGEETDEDLKKRQERRWQTSALTRDGVEVVPNVFVLFRLEPPPKPEELDEKSLPLFERLVRKYSRREEVRSGFGYNPDSVIKALSHTSIDPEASHSSEGRYRDWTQIPALLAVDVWREYLRKFTFDELFTFTSLNPTDRNRRTAFEIIADGVKSRMTKSEFEVLDESGRQTGVFKLSPEYVLLKERGMDVIAVSISNPRFEKHVDEKLFSQWRTNWLDRANEEARFVNQERKFAEVRGEEMALAHFADSASRLLGHHLINTPGTKPDLNNSLEYMVRGSLEQCLRDPELQEKLKDERLDLAEIIEWIRSH
ncbi:MAG: hypothetical protein HUU38_15385 [Anaerolineales bacterium]|jgi:hypothetical protein|nr:hypothetical protein [Anaerolineales bacterium]